MTTTARRRAPSGPAVLGLVLLLAGLLALSVVLAVTVRGSFFAGTSTAGLRWPPDGQAALRMPGLGRLESSGPETPVPIASVTKVMTAILVLERFPIRSGEPGFSIGVTRADLRSTERAQGRGESTVPLEADEELSERDALLALLLPSANNVARLLAVRVAGSEAAFVKRMNARAHELQLDDTSYADASGFDPRSVSTARDQVVLAEAAMRIPTFAWLVRQPSATIPVAGVVRSTDRLLGHDGYVGIKTGSHAAAGGCFVFAVNRRVDGRPQLVIGAVLGQRGPDLIEAALDSTEALVDSVG